MKSATNKKRKSGIPTGNAGEYFVMGELLRQGYDAQLADRNTKGYDILVGSPEGNKLRKVQVKSVRVPPWYVNRISFQGKMLREVTIYVLIGSAENRKPIRFFITKNREVASHFSQPTKWKNNTGFMSLAGVRKYEDKWHALKKLVNGRSAVE